MDPLQIALRVVHIVGGVFWAGGMLFVTHFLEPAVRDSGPDGAKVMQALQKRRYMDVMPVVAAFTLVSGFWLYFRTFGGAHPGPGASGPALWLGTGGLLALVAFVVGMTLVRPSAVRAGALGVELAQAPPERKDALAAEVARLRRRMRLGGRIVAGLLGLTIICMAVGRYS
jgi:uncharacterized membrane protein